MRDHIYNTMLGIQTDLERLRSAGQLDPLEDPGSVIGFTVDALDRLTDERRWLETQPLSSLLDDEARMAVNTYRFLLSRAQILAERWIVDMEDPSQGEATFHEWLAAIGKLVKVTGDLDVYPEA